MQDANQKLKMLMQIQPTFFLKLQLGGIKYSPVEKSCYV